MRTLGNIAKKLPSGRYALPKSLNQSQILDASLAWSRALYKWDKHKKPKSLAPILVSKDISSEVNVYNEAAYWVRDWVNSPAGEFGPTHFEKAAKELAKSHGAKCDITQGDELEKNFPMVHAVGRAAKDQPRLIDITWGDPKDPKLTIVGKGVCFDTGGLDIKPSQFMRNMKKDMGGGAHALGLAHIVMSKKLPVRLRCLVPAVENNVDGNAFRPGDILQTRKGLSVEIHNTDAEGRLILGDALALASEDKPALLLDFATLTGAARVALGPELPALFTHDDKLAYELSTHCKSVGEPLWRMPLHKPYKKYLDSSVADLSNAAKTRHAGCITAALFLESFVADETEWAHIDLYAWNDSSGANKPTGGEAQCLRGITSYLSERFSKPSA